MPPKRLSARPQPVLPDEQVWDGVTRGARPLKRDTVAPELPKLPKVYRPEAPGPADYARADSKTRRVLKPSPLGIAGAAAPPRMPHSQMDGRLKQRLMKGQLEIEQRLDLHGMTLRQAEQAMGRLLREAVARHQRCLLVITGKGAGAADSVFERRGVLRAWLPEYLQRGPWREVILGLAPARIEHGGSGAFYVLLRRQREK